MQAGPAFDASPNSNQHFHVQVPVFVGPLDLLLHLIRKDQINIYDIPIAEICESYLAHLDLMQQPDVNLAGEFMVMAATLAHMKSLILLPQENAEGEEDPRLPLVARLLEYERFKDAANALDGRVWLGRDTFIHPASSDNSVVPVEALANTAVEPIEVFQLLVCLKTATLRTTRLPLEIDSDKSSIRAKVNELMTLFDTSSEVSAIVDFSLLLPADHHVREVIISFLAMLELARLHFVEIIQHQNFGPIQLRMVKPLQELDTGLLEQY